MITSDQIKNVLKEYRTPFYIFDIDDLNNYLETALRKLGNNVAICYAMKANPMLVGFISKKVDKIEVCSMGEFEICQNQNVPLDKIVLSGVYKDYADIDEIFKMSDSEKITYTIESLEQFKIFNELSQKYYKKISVLLRLSTGNQFGMEENEIVNITIESKLNDYLIIKGLQYYSGTQKKDFKIIKNELENLINLMEKIENDHNVNFSEVEFGPGTYVEYFKDEDNTESLEGLLTIMTGSKYTLTLELGRFLVAPFGYYVSKVVDSKQTNSINYRIIDGGINHINYYGQIMGLKVPKVTTINESSNSTNNLNDFTICGSLCTSSDVLIKRITAPNIDINDYLVFHNIGAYSITEAMYLFLSRDMPKVLLKINNEFHIGRNNIKTSSINSMMGTISSLEL